MTDTQSNPSVAEAVNGLLHTLAIHHTDLPRLVRIAYESRDHHAPNIGLWTFYLTKLQEALFEVPPLSLPSPVRAAFIDVLIAQCEVQA
jgi:hypothetical protein